MPRKTVGSARAKRARPIALIVTLLSHYAFYKLLRVPLPWGLLQGIAWSHASLVLIMGSDQFQRFDTWREWETICDLAHIAVARRAGVAADLNPTLDELWRRRQCGPAELAHRTGGGIVEFPMSSVDASATEARRLLANPQAVSESRLARLLPAAVLDYIRAHHLYA